MMRTHTTAFTPPAAGRAATPSAGAGPARLAPVDAARTGGRTKSLLSGIRAIRGRPSPLELALATSPAALEGHLAFGAALADGALEPKLRQRIALAVVEAMRSEYALAAAVATARRAGFAEQEIGESRLASSNDRREDAALRFAHAVLALSGHVGDEDLRRVRAAGWSEGEIAEIVAQVALAVFTSLFANVARPEFEKPRVPPPAVPRGIAAAYRAVELLV